MADSFNRLGGARAPVDGLTPRQVQKRLADHSNTLAPPLPLDCVQPLGQ
jgi:hypothetical protein